MIWVHTATKPAKLLNHLNVVEPSIRIKNVLFLIHFKNNLLFSKFIRTLTMLVWTVQTAEINKVNKHLL